MVFPASAGPSPPTAALHPSLPARPPPSNQPLPSLNAHGYGGSRGYGTSSPAISAGPSLPPGFDSAGASAGLSQTTFPGYFPPDQGANNYSATPVIHNPFPLPGQASKSSYDPELEAQIQQWQSAYSSKDDSSAKGSSKPAQNTHGSRAAAASSTHGSDATAAEGGSAGSGGPQTVVRRGGGKTWEDNTLLEWDPAHFRLFIGNLAGEVTDDSLLKAFSKYGSVQKARVVRDKRTTKSKNYGFVSFSDGDDMFKAAKEMAGKYIGSHPVIIKRSDTDITHSRVQNKDARNKNRRNRGGFNNGHANTGAGVKKHQHDKGGMKVLG
jgi:hypothetical protein